MSPASRLGLLVGVTLAFTAPASVAWAHGIGVRGDLPVPLSMVSYGAGAILVASFAGLAVLWPHPRLESAPASRAVPAPGGRAVGWAEWPVRLMGVVAFAAVVVAAFVGPMSPTENLAPVAVYVGLWVGGLVASALLGDVWSVVSPFETAAEVVRATAMDPGERATAPLARVGVWPAAGSLLGFGWLELVHPDAANPRVLAAAIAVYVLVIAAGAMWWGRRWIRSAEAFGAILRVVAAMAPLHRGDHGRLRLRLPLAGLAHLEASAGTTALILVALGTTTFDGLTRQPFWESLLGGRTGWAVVPYATVGLLAAVALVAALYLWAMHEAARITGRGTGELADAFAHSLVPIALAYAVAHYFSLLVFEGQRLLALASDPVQAGWDLFGTADWTVDFTLVSPTTIAWVQVGAIVAGHLAGVLLAHDRAVAWFRGKVATRSQIPLLLAMVVYTIGGLVLLLGGG